MLGELICMDIECETDQRSQGKAKGGGSVRGSVETGNTFGAAVVSRYSLNIQDGRVNVNVSPMFIFLFRDGQFLPFLDRIPL